MDISPEASEAVSGPDVRGLRDALDSAPPVTGLEVSMDLRCSSLIVYPGQEGQTELARAQRRPDMQRYCVSKQAWMQAPGSEPTTGPSILSQQLKVTSCLYQAHTLLWCNP